MGGVGAVTGATNLQMSAAATAMQEANETAATTKVEAAQGDQQAVRRVIVRSQQQNATPAAGAIAPQVGKAAPGVSPEGVGKAINRLA